MTSSQIQKIFSYLLSGLLLFTSFSPAYGSPFHPFRFAKQWAESGPFRTHFFSRNLGATQLDLDKATRWKQLSVLGKQLPFYIPTPSHFFKGPTVAWLRSGLYKYARKMFRPLAKYMGIELPSGWRSPDTFAEAFHGVMGLRRKSDGTRVPDATIMAIKDEELIKDGELIIKTGRKSKFMDYLPEDTRTRLRASAEEAAEAQVGHGAELGEVVADLAGNFKTAEDGAPLRARTLQDLLDILSYEAWSAFFKDKISEIVDPLRDGPFATMRETVRKLNNQRSAQLSTAFDIIHHLQEYETFVDQYLAKLYDRLVEYNAKLQEVDRAIKNPDTLAFDRKAHEAKRAKLATEYMAILNDLTLFIRIKQYDIRATLQYMYGIFRNDKVFQALGASEDIVRVVDTSLRNTEGVSQDARERHFAEDEQDHLPTFRGMEKFNYRFGRLGEAIDRANEQMRVRGRKGVLSDIFETLRSRKWEFTKRTFLVTLGTGLRLTRFLWQGLPERFGFGRFGFNTNLFPCVRDGALLYYCRLSKPAHDEINNLLTQFRNDIEAPSTTPKDHKFYANLRDKYINLARANRHTDHRDILQGLFSLMTQMNPHSRAGRQFRNLLHPGQEAAGLHTTRLGELKAQRTALEEDKTKAQAALRDATDPEVQKHTQYEIDGIDKSLTGVTEEILQIEREWEQAALDLSQNRYLSFTPNGMPIYDFPANGKFFSIGSPLLTLPFKGIRSIYRFGRGFVGGGWIANGLSDQAAFFARTRRMIAVHNGGTLPKNISDSLNRAEERTSTVLRASFQLGLTPAQSQQLINAVFVPKDTQAFLNILTKFIDPYRRFSENRSRLFEQLDQLEKNYNRRLFDLDAVLAGSIRETTDVPTAERALEQAEIAIADAHRLRMQITELEKALGIDARTSVEVSDAPLAKQEAFHRSTTAYQRYRTRYLRISDEIQNLEEKIAKGTASEDDLRELDQLRPRRDSVRSALDSAQAEMTRYFEEYKAFAKHHKHMEVALSDVEAVERDLSRLLGERDSLQARIAEAEPYRDSEDWDLVAELANNKRRLAALEPLIAQAEQALTDAKALFRRQYPEYNLEARLRRRTLERDLPGRTGARWNQLTYEMLQSSGFEKQALREGSEALALVERLRRYGAETGDETWTRVVRHCVGNFSQGRAMLGAPGIRGTVNLRPWTADFYRQFFSRDFYRQLQDPFSGTHNQARLDYLHDAALPTIPSDLLDTLEPTAPK